MDLPANITRSGEPKDRKYSDKQGSGIADKRIRIKLMIQQKCKPFFYQNYTFRWGWGGQREKKKSGESKQVRQSERLCKSVCTYK